MREARHRVMRKLENAALRSLSELLARKRSPRQLHRAWRLMAAVYAFCKRLPTTTSSSNNNNSSGSSFVTERALYYHLKSTFTGQRSLNAALQRLTAALNCPRQ